MPQIQSFPHTPLGTFVERVKAAHSPSPQQPNFKQDALQLTLGASGGILAFTALSLSRGSFSQLKHSSFVLPALTGAVSGWAASHLTEHKALQVAVGATAGAAVGLALHRAGVMSSGALVQGAVAGAGGSVMGVMVQD